MVAFYEKMRLESSLLFLEIQAADRQKKDISVDENQNRLTAIYRDYLKRCDLEARVEIKFFDVHQLIGHPAHTELAYVVITGNTCKLLFHPKILSFEKWEAGFVFVYKSWVLLMVVIRLWQRYGHPDAEFLFEVGDNGEFDSVSFCSRHERACLILDYDYAKSNGYWHFKQDADSGPKSWHDRKTQFFWRGSTTGRRISSPLPEGAEDNWVWLQRLQLCHATRSREIAEWCDVGITTVVQVDERYIQERIRAANFIRPPVPRARFMDYKFLFDVDGNSNAWAGLYCSLYGRSCVLKVESPFGYRQWYYYALKPWKAFVPIDKDLSNLNDVVHWLLQNVNYAQEIAENGRRVAQGIAFESALEYSVDALSNWLEAK